MTHSLWLKRIITKWSRDHQEMRSEPSDQNFPAIECIARSATVNSVAVDCIVTTDHEVSLVVTGLKPTTACQHIAAGRIQNRLELLVATVNGVEEDSRVRADKNLRNFSGLLEGDSPNRCGSEDDILDSFCFIASNVALVNGNVATIESNRHALSVLRHAERCWLLKIRFDHAQAGWNRLVQFTQIPHFEFRDGFG